MSDGKLLVVLDTLGQGVGLKNKHRILNNVGSDIDLLARVFFCDILEELLLDWLVLGPEVTGEHLERKQVFIRSPWEDSFIIILLILIVNGSSLRSETCISLPNGLTILP